MISANRDLQETLSRVDWDFAARTAIENNVHSLHWFPGNFIPQIPSYLVQLLSDPGQLVFDPFCGSGTTGVEAARLGRATRLSDINHASIQVTKGKLAAFGGSAIVRDLRVMQESLVWETLARSASVGANGEGQSEELMRWYDPDTLGQLRYIWSLRERFRGAISESLIELIFADTLFFCASTGRATTSTGGTRRHHWGWIADNVVPKPPVWHNAIKAFRDRVVHAIAVVNSLNHGPPLAATHVSREDARALDMPDASVDLIVSSPPYVGMIDYTRANRLTYLWMNWPFDTDRRNEIGARYRRNTIHLLDDYADDMKSVATEFARVLKPQCYCALVIGSSRKFSGGGELVLSLLAEHLNPVWGPQSRIPSRRRVSDRQGREPHEWICVYQKPS